MNIIIIGCGKTGARLANTLDEYGYDVAVVANSEDAFNALDDSFSGLTVCGEVTDTDVLRNAGCDNADAAIVVTESDNVNVMVAQTLEVVFEIKNVFLRILDPTRESVFRRFGLRTVCPTRFETDILFNLITQDAEQIDSISVCGSSIHFSMQKADKKEIGREPPEVVTSNTKMLFAVRRKSGEVVFADRGDFVIEEGDMVIYATL